MARRVNRRASWLRTALVEFYRANAARWDCPASRLTLAEVEHELTTGEPVTVSAAALYLATYEGAPSFAAAYTGPGLPRRWTLTADDQLEPITPGRNEPRLCC